MKFKPYLLASLLFCLLFSLSAQPLETVFRKLTDGQINQAILLRDGKIAAVGSRLNSEKNYDGLFLIYDPQKDSMLTSVSIRAQGEGSRDEVLNGLAEANDESFYLVGSCERGAELGRQAWIVRVNAEGVKQPSNFFGQANREYFGEKGENWFEKIVRFDDGSALLAGFRTAELEGKGRIWISTLRNGRIESCAAVGEGFVGNVVAMERTRSQDSVWLCGNTESSDISKKGNGWAMLLDKNGRSLQSAQLSEQAAERFYSASLSWDNSLLMVGQITDFPSFKPETRIAEAGAFNKKENPLAGWAGRSSVGAAKAVLKTENNEGFLVVQGRKPAAQLLYFNAENFEKLRTVGDFSSASDLMPIHGNDELLVSNVIETYDHTIVVAGSGPSAATDGRQAAQLLVFKKNEKYIPQKPMHKGDDSQLKYNGQKLVKPSADESLQSNESGSLQLSFTNTGTGVFPDGRLVVTIENSVQGFFTKNEATYYFRALSPNAVQKIDIPIRGESDLATGVVKLRVAVRSGNIEKFIIYPTVPCNLKAVLPPPNPADDPKKVKFLPSDDARKGVIQLDGADSYETKMVVISKKKVDNAHFVVMKNGTPQVDQKTNGLKISEVPYEKNGEFIYTLTLEVHDLKTDLNEVYVEYDGEQSEKLSIHYEPTLPNLHILAIGPAYSKLGQNDLRFPSKDAREVAQAFLKMQNNRFYKTVFIDTLTTNSLTTKREIEVAFENLLDRATDLSHPRHIKKQDYLVVFYSGHGIFRESDKTFCLQPADFDMAHKKSTFVNLKEMLETYLNPIKCKKILLIDACFSGAAKNGEKNSKDERIAQAVSEAYRTAAETTILSSCSSDEVSYELPDLKNGAFTIALLEAVAGKSVKLQNGETISPTGTPADDVVTLGELFDFLKKRVPDLIGRYREKDAHQTPDMPEKKLPDSLPFFIIK